MKWNKVYRGQFANQETSRPDNEELGVIVTIDIYDTTSGEAVSPTNIIPIELSENPVYVETIDNEEDKFKAVIRSIRANATIHSSDSIGIETFVDGGDTRFYGEIYIESTNYYFIKGFVSVSDIEEPFQPDPNIIPITITDGLGFMAEEELTDENGDPLSGVQNYWYFIRLALLKTGLSLPATAVFNIREKTALTLNTVGNNAGHFFQHEYLDARTLEGDNVGTMINADEVISRLLFGCFITQYNGRWWIIRIDEMQYDTVYNLTLIDEDGNFSDNSGNNYIKFIGAVLPLSWMNDDTNVITERGLKRLDLIRHYDYFKEIPCNVDFERGVGDVSTGAASETIDSDPECWTYLREGASNVDLDSQPYPGSLGKLRKLYELDYEKDRKLVSQQAGGFRHYFKSQGIEMDANSRLSISVNYWFDSDIGSATINVMHIRLVGNDGNLYDLEYLSGARNQWVQKVASDPVFDQTIQEAVDTAIDMRDNHVFSFETASVPVEGRLYIRLLNTLASPLTRFFSGLKVDYVPLINGSVNKYTSERHTIEQEGDYKAKREDTIYVGSGPGRNVKGCLLKRGDNLEIFSGNVSFGASGQFEISGDKRPVFSPYLGERIIIEGSASNDQEVVITSITYSIIGNITTVFTDGTTTTELSVAITVGAATYVKSELFYNATVLPDGPFEDAQSKPYGEMVAFDIWNQYNRVMRKFEGTVDGLNSNDQVPHLIQKYVLTDPNANTGSRAFMVLHFTQDIHMCSMDIFLHEVHNPDNGKSYTGHSFKYLTQ